MTIQLLSQLQSADGQRLLDELAREENIEERLPFIISHYRQAYPPELVSAAVNLVRRRRRAREKFSRAGEMYFTADGLEMSSSEIVARHVAARFSGMPLIWDLCCGIGGDTIALASEARRVIAVDNDPLALAMARLNAGLYGVDEGIEFVNADAQEFASPARALLGAPSAIYVDPSRREERAAARRPEAYSPPLSWCVTLTEIAPSVAIKVSPALDYEQWLAGVGKEIEVISLRGECKAIIIWLGDFRTRNTRATLLPAELSLDDRGPSSDAVLTAGSWLFEPDAAIIRAHLVQRLAGELQLWRIDEDIAYLSGDHPVDSPYASCYPVREVLPWQLKRLNARLQEMSVGRVTIKKRGFPLTPEQLRPKLKLKGPNAATLFCTRQQGKPVVVITDEKRPPL